MKRLSIYLLLPAIFLLNTASMCSNDDSASSSNVDPADVVNTMTSGGWVVSNYNENGIDNTSYFAGFTFTFGADNVLTATNGAIVNTGVWSVTSDDANDDSPSSSGIDFNILFTAPPYFAEISEDWDILERTATKVRLRHISGGDGTTDLLTFDKI